MIVKLLTEHHLEFLSLKGGCRGLSESTRFKNATLLEISCTGSFYYGLRSYLSSGLLQLGMVFYYKNTNDDE